VHLVDIWQILVVHQLIRGNVVVDTTERRSSPALFKLQSHSVLKNVEAGRSLSQLEIVSCKIWQKQKQLVCFHSLVAVFVAVFEVHLV